MQLSGKWLLARCTGICIEMPCRANLLFDLGHSPENILVVERDLLLPIFANMFEFFAVPVVALVLRGCFKLGLKVLSCATRDISVHLNRL